MYSFLCEFPPRSVRGEKSHKFKEAIVNSFKKYNTNFNYLNSELYGIAYYFHNRPTQIDADNLSKPIWDALEDVLYKDDKIIKIRYAGVFDLKKSKSLIDFTNIQTHIFNDFLEKIDGSDHLIYIEIGELNYSLYKFGVE